MVKFVFQKNSFSEEHSEKTKTTRYGLSRGQVKSGTKQYIGSECQYNKDGEKNMNSSVSWETGWSITLKTKKKYTETGIVQKMEKRKDSEISLGHLKLKSSQRDMKVIQGIRSKQAFSIKGQTAKISVFVNHV